MHEGLSIKEHREADTAHDESDSRNQATDASVFVNEIKKNYRTKQCPEVLTRAWFIQERLKELHDDGLTVISTCER